MSAVRVTIHSTGLGTCALTGKEESDGLSISFENEPACFLSWRSFKQLLSMKAAQTKPEVKPTVALPANGPAVVAPN